jgi:hypothetical protein
MCSHDRGGFGFRGRDRNRIARMTAEREQLVGRYTALTEEATRYKRELAQEKRTAEQVRIDLSSAQLQREAAQTHLEQLRGAQPAANHSRH